MKFRLNLRTIIAAATLGLSTTAAAAFPADKDDPWNVLRNVTRRTTYVFEDQQLNCVYGRIHEVSDQGVTIKRIGGATNVMARPEVLRVADSGRIQDVIYSGRSSWTDVQSIKASPKEPIRVITKDSRRYEGPVTGASGQDIMMKQSGRTVRLLKNDISQVFYIRIKPASASAQYADQELFFLKVLDPELWPYMFGINSRIAVRLYDASLPENNRTAECKTPIRQ